MNINFKDLPGIIKTSLIDGLAFLKVINKIPGSKRYFAASVLLIIVFVFITFPYEELIKKNLHEGAGKGYSSARIAGLDVGVIGSTEVGSLELYFPDYTELSIEKADLGLSVNPYRLFVSRRIKTDLDIHRIKYSGKENNFQGKLTGDIDITMGSKANVPENGSVLLNITQGILQVGIINIPTSMGNIPLKTDTINIKLLNFDADITNRVLKIKKFTIDSEELRCSFTGSMTIEPFMKNSKFEMKMILNPDSKVLDQHRDIINALSKGEPIVINIGGTAGRPEFKLEKNEN